MCKFALAVAAAFLLAGYVVCRVERTASHATADSDVIAPLAARDPSVLVMGPRR